MRSEEDSGLEEEIGNENSKGDAEAAKEELVDEEEEAVNKERGGVGSDPKTEEKTSE